ncbi:MAG: glycosyltransferase 87 family protein, partial [Gaiellaceae bacterium]
AASALALVAVSPLLLGSIVLSRFDLWPAALTVGALAALLSGRDRLGAVVLGAAVAAKLYPVVLVPLGLAWIWRRRGGRAAAAWLGLLAVVLAAIFLPFAVVSPGGLEHSFGTQLGRPLQVESLGAALLVAAHHISGFALHPHSDHGSQNLEGTAAAWVGGVSTGLQLALLGSVWAAFARGPARPERLVTAAAAAVGAFVAFGKVFSPQFLIWLIPLVPLVGGRVGARAAALLASALVLTQIWFPKRYWQYALGFKPFESSLVLARDVLAAALAVLLLRSLLQDQPLREDRPVREPLQPVGRQVELRSS